MSARVLLGLLLIGLSGCASARFVQVDPAGGVLAIPENTNVWPTYYRDKAEAMLRQRYPRGYDIVREEEVVTGQTAHTNTETSTAPPPGIVVAGGVTVPLGPSEEQVRQTTQYTNNTEWRIHYRAK